MWGELACLFNFDTYLLLLLCWVYAVGLLSSNGSNSRKDSTLKIKELQFCRCATSLKINWASVDFCSVSVPKQIHNSWLATTLLEVLYSMFMWVTDEANGLNVYQRWRVIGWIGKEIQSLEGVLLCLPCCISLEFRYNFWFNACYSWTFTFSHHSCHTQHGGFLKCCTGVQDTSRNGNFSTKEQVISERIP